MYRYRKMFFFFIFKHKVIFLNLYYLLFCKAPKKNTFFYICAIVSSRELRPFIMYSKANFVNNLDIVEYHMNYFTLPILLSLLIISLQLLKIWSLVFICFFPSCNIWCNLLNCLNWMLITISYCVPHVFSCCDKYSYV